MKRSKAGEDAAEVAKKKVGSLNVPSLCSSTIYFTSVGILPDRFNERAISLAALLELIRPIASLHFNFMIDLPWLLSKYPVPCKKTPITVVVGEKMGTQASDLRKEVASKKLDNVTVFGARLPIPFGTHHTKLSIFESNENIHVVVSTANLIPGDWTSKTQLLFHVCAPIINSDTPSVFSEDLLVYLGTYNLEALNYWKSRIRAADFSSVKDRLVYSVPGYHIGANLKKYGHPALRNLLKDFEDAPKANPGVGPESSTLYVAQCSSIGSLGKDAAAWLKGQFLTSLNGGKLELGDSRLFLVYPCVEDVRNSIEGYDAGCSLPYQSKTDTRQPWLRGLMCKWRSETNGRSKAMPHVKTFTKLVDGQPKWMVVTSANLSKAAWGELQSANEKLCIRSYELGVLITDPSRIVLPYDYPLIKHSANDEPWVTDKNHLVEDSQGQTWTVR